MKKISLMLMMAGGVLTAQFANAQTSDTSKNKIEVKKKVKTGVHGRQVTKIKIEGKGTPSAISDAAASAVTGRTRVVVAPAPAPAAPQVVVVTPRAEARPATTPTTVTTTTVTKPAVTTRTSTSATRTTTAHVVAKKPTTHVYHRVYRRPAKAAGTKTVTTTTIKKSDSN